jgi:hypothetical protein
MNKNLILYNIINNNNIICELLLRDEEMENELLMNLIPKKKENRSVICFPRRTLKDSLKI